MSVYLQVLWSSLSNKYHTVLVSLLSSCTDVTGTCVCFYIFRSEQLLRERMRATGNGITSYDYQENDSIVVHGSQCVVVDRQTVSDAFEPS